MSNKDDVDGGVGEVEVVVRSRSKVLSVARRRVDKWPNFAICFTGQN